MPATATATVAAPAGFSRTQIALHWIVFALIALQFLLHEPISEAWDRFEDGLPVVFHPAVAGHVIGGLAVLVLALWRLILRRRRGVPALPAEEPAPLRMIAQATHVGLYALMVLMPVSGALAWFGGAEAAAETHEILRLLLLALVALHVAGALYQQLVLKTGIMARMRRPG